MTPNAAFLHLIFAVAITGFSAALAGAILLYIYSRIIGFIGDPNEASSLPIPSLSGGGFAIVGGFLAGISLIQLVGNFTPIKTNYFWGFSASLLLIAMASLYGNFSTRGLPLTAKLGAQVLIVAILMGAGVVIDEVNIPWVGPVRCGWLGYPLTLLWVLGLTNAYNLMNGQDGIAASTAVIASAFFSIIALQQQSLFIYLSSLVLCAASLGFLFFNWPPAKIIMDDIGSTFLGFTLAVMAIIAFRYDRSHTSLLVVPLLLFHFIFDTVFTLVRRLLRGETVTQGRGTHLYQLLNQLGYSHRKVIMIYSGIAFIQGLGAVWMVNISGDKRVFIYLPFFLVYVVYGVWLLNCARRRGLI